MLHGTHELEELPSSFVVRVLGFDIGLQAEKGNFGDWSHSGGMVSLAVLYLLFISLRKSRLRYIYCNVFVLIPVYLPSSRNDSLDREDDVGEE